MQSLSIIVPTYNGLKHLARCLPSVCRHAPRGTQIIVADDASTDGTSAWIERHFPQVELIALPDNRGFCHAVNEGLKRARGEVVELLNNDTEVRAGWADAALRHFRDPSIGSVAPLVLKMETPDIIDSAGQAYHICGWASDRGFGRKLTTDYLTACEVFGPSASAGFYRRQALERLGGLLPEYGAYFEDTDLAFRLRWAGYRCLYEPAAQVLHRGSASYGQHSDRVIRLLSRNEELVYWINLPGRDLLAGLPLHLGFLAVRTARKAWSGRLGPFIQGKLQALAHWKTIAARRRQVARIARGDQQAIRGVLSRDVRVLSDGLTWLIQRQCA